METLEVKFINPTFDELMWVREFVRRNQTNFTAEVNLSSISGTILDILPRSTITLKTTALGESTFKQLGELTNYLQSANIKATTMESQGK